MDNETLSKAADYLKKLKDTAKVIEEREKEFTKPLNDTLKKIRDVFRPQKDMIEKLKTTLYECGPEVTKQPNSISTQFYLTALLFILFDVEIIFMFPWAINFKILGWFGFVEMILFITLLAIGFLYAWKKGALEWHSIK